MFPNLELLNRTVVWIAATSAHPTEGAERASEGRFVARSGMQPSAAQEVVSGICCWCWPYYVSVGPSVAHHGDRSTKSCVCIPEYWQRAGIFFFWGGGCERKRLIAA